MVRGIGSLLLAGFAALLGGSPALAGGAELFPIALEQPVSDGVPAPGAGNIEQVGDIDTYELTVAKPTTAYFQDTSGGCHIVWRCVGPSGDTLFANDPVCVVDPGVVELLEPGIYTIIVSGGSGTGTYGFTVWELNQPETFSLAYEETVSDGFPNAGAGNLEEPGAIDRYELTVTAPQTVYADELGGSCSIEWRCTGPSATTVFASQPICVGDPAVLQLNEPGTYTFEVSGPTGAVGTYSFKIWTVEPPQVFPISVGQTVSAGSPGPGAGTLEEPGAIDRYELSIATPTNVYFDEINGGCPTLWSCLKPDTSQLFAANPLCVGDPGQFLLLDTGTYLIEVHSGASSSVGTYSFKTVEVEPPQIFAITVGTVVSDGVPGPGAGNIESPASIDIYTFEAGLGDAVCFLDGSGSCGLRWRLLDPSGAIVFDDPAVCVSDPGTFILPASGVYQVVVYGESSTTGSYSVSVLPSRYGDLDNDCHVAAPDLAILLGAWGPCGKACDADLNGSGAVDAADLALMLGEWG